MKTAVPGTGGPEKHTLSVDMALTTTAAALCLPCVQNAEDLLVVRSISVGVLCGERQAGLKGWLV